MAKISEGYPGPGDYEVPFARSMTVLASPRKSVRASSPAPPMTATSPRPCDLLAADDGRSTQGAFSSGSYSARGGSQFASGMVREVRGLVVQRMGDPGAHSSGSVSGVHAGRHETMGCRSARSYNKDSARGSGSFCSKSPRPSGVSQTPRAASAPRGTVRRGDPGLYDYDHMFVLANPRSMTPRPTGQFRSATSLGGHIRKSEKPGVGDYETSVNLLKDGHNFSRLGSSNFAGKAMKQREGITARKSTAAIVGPGYYDLEMDGDGRGSIKARADTKVNKRLPGFGSSSRRKAPWE